ncbi:BQ2448_487 [Microbotryum intermedium]|uniref:BQ2448_487 protein n=1 Tax=Microbotryum intermedium TaxID=269621 RepID=A0A238FBA7_9BASI|nr:BQ2448_487 [Microbotryum intermedium]
MPFLNPSNLASTCKSMLSSNAPRRPLPTFRPLLAPVRALASQSLTRSFRLSPRTRTRLQNVSFLTATLVSIITVSLAMSGSAGVDLPCPARQGTRVGMQDEKGNEWALHTTNTTRTVIKGKRRWLDEPVVVAHSTPRGEEGHERTGPRTGVEEGEGKD